MSLLLYLSGDDLLPCVQLTLTEWPVHIMCLVPSDAAAKNASCQQEIVAHCVVEPLHPGQPRRIQTYSHGSVRSLIFTEYKS
jgi:hypothetical protein